MHQTLTLSEIVPMWLTSRSYAPESARLRTIQATRFIDAVGDKPPSEIDLADVLRWWATTETMAPNSRRSAWMAMRGLMRWCCAVGMATANPIEAIRVPPEPDLAPRAVTADELERICRRLPDKRFRLAVALAAGAGLRRSEIVSLRGCDVDRSALPWTITVRRKGGKTQVLPVESAWLHDELADVGDGRKPLIDLAPNYLSYRVREMMQAAGVEDRTLHSLRHFYAQDALRRMPVNRVQKLLGHKSLNTTGRYLVA